MADRPDGAPPRLRPLGVAAAILGLLLFVWALRQTGTSQILEGARRVGWGFLVILALSGLRFWVRAWAWAIATDAIPPLRVRETFPALVAGDALGNLTPLGLFVSEPVKAAYVRPRVPLMDALTGITIENLLYTMSVAVVIAAGMVALLVLFNVGEAARDIAVGALVVIALAFALGGFMLTRQVKLVSRGVEAMERHGRAPAAVVSRLETLRTFEDLIYGFAGRHPQRVASILGLELAFHVLGVVEMWFTLALLVGAAAPTLLNTFVLESVNRTIMVAFKFVPLRLGVDEVGTELLTRTLGLPAGVGVTMALVRKVRMLAWAAVGVAILARRPFGRRAERSEARGQRPEGR